MVLSARAGTSPLMPGALLDVVVLGGGGHVGLPLSLAFADAGLRVGIYDINEPTLERIARRRDAVHGERRRRAARRGPARPAASSSSTDASMIERTDAVIVVIGTPVDEFLGPSMTIFEQTRRPDRAAPPRRRARRPAQHRLPGHDRVRRRSASRQRGCERRRRVLPRADRRGPRARGAAHAAPDHRRRRRTRAADRAEALFAQLGAEDDPHDVARKPSSRSCSRTRGGT